MGNRQKIIILVIVVVLVAGVGFWYWQMRRTSPTTENESIATTPLPATSTTENAGESIGGEIFEKTQNPLKENLPETNPLKQIIRNPF